MHDSGKSRSLHLLNTPLATVLHTTTRAKCVAHAHYVQGVQQGCVTLRIARQFDVYISVYYGVQLARLQLYT